jgi:hypothetical protein
MNETVSPENIPTSKPGDPDKMIKNSGGGCASLFGLPFFLVGLFIIAMSCGGVHTEGNRPLPLFVGIPFGGLFAMVGFAFLVGRSGTIIDRRGKTLTTWASLIVPIRNATRSLLEFDKVTLGKEVRESHGKNGSSQYTVYPVRLEGAGKPFTYAEPRIANEARKESEALATFLNYPMVDTSTGTKVERRANILNKSLREQFARSGEERAMPTAPEVFRGNFSVSGDTAVFEIPPAEFQWMSLLPAVIVGAIMLIPLVFFLIFAIVSMKNFGSIGFLFIAIPLLVVFFGLWKLKQRVVAGIVRWEKITASPRSLRVETHIG